jgi:hypothetical protein
MCPADLGISSSPYTGWQISLHGLANFLHRMAEALLHAAEYSGIFGRIFVYKSFYEFLYKFFYNSLHNT